MRPNLRWNTGLHYSDMVAHNCEQMKFLDGKVRVRLRPIHSDVHVKCSWISFDKRQVSWLDCDSILNMLLFNSRKYEAVKAKFHLRSNFLISKSSRTAC